MKTGVMKEIRENLISFRNQLDVAIQANRGKKDPYCQGVVAVVTAIKSDFDRLFDPGILKCPAKYLDQYIEKYCESDRMFCPICGNTMTTSRSSKRFVICLVASCGGQRHTSGKVKVNDALRLFLTNKVKEETLRQVHEGQSRFRNLDLS
jgi:hypothetical protein